MENKITCNNCTIVSCYYRTKSKHTLSQYDEWMANFLKNINNNMVIFCDKDSYNKICEFRKEYKDITKICILSLEETYCGSNKYKDIWDYNHSIDIEKNIHNPNLYIIWNEKAMFVKRVIKQNPFNTDFFCWCDIGCFRNKDDMYLFKNTEWPTKNFLETARTDKMYFLNLIPFNDNDHIIYKNGLTRTFERDIRMGGTIFLGHKNVFEEYIKKFYQCMDNYINNNYFAGKDQNIIATLYILFPELFKLINPVKNEGDPWFYLQRYFLYSHK